MMFRTISNYLLPRYNARENSHVQYYDGIDSRNSDSEEAASHFLDSLQFPQQETNVSSDGEESSSSEEDTPQNENAGTEKLRARFHALLKQYPAHTMAIKTAAYEGGIYESIAYDPQINRFFRVLDNVDESKLPDEVALFCKEIKDYTPASNRSLGV